MHENIENSGSKAAAQSRRDRLRRSDPAADAAAQPGGAMKPSAVVNPLLASTPVVRPGFSYLSPDRIAALHDRVLRLLDRHGVAIDHEIAVERLCAAGARRGADGKRIQFPPAMVEAAIAATPRTVTLCGKRPEFDIALPRPDGTFTMRTGTGAHSFIDPRDGRYRKLVLDDVNDIAAIGSALGNVGFIAHPFVNGVPEVTSDLHSLARLIARTDKHVWMQPYGEANVAHLMRIAAIAAGGEDSLRARPIASCIITAFTPLEFKRMDAEAILQCGRYGVPMHTCSLPTAGGTAPVTMAGAALMAAAEIGAMLVMAHVLAPGTPVIATPLMFNLDMRTGRSLQSSVEAMQGVSMAVQFMKEVYRIPVHTYGAGSDTPAIDGQAQAERALLGHLAGLAGADILGGVGQLECATVFSPVQAVVDDELGQMLRHYLQTPQIDDDSTAWDLMMSLEAGGHFLASAHTMRHCRTAMQPAVFQRLSRDAYDGSDQRDALAAARDLCLATLAAAAPSEALDGAQIAAIAEEVRRGDAAIVEN